MSPGRVGMDTDEVRALGDLMSREALHLEAVRLQIEATVFALRWLGPDGEALRDAWASHGRRSLAAAADRLREASRDLAGEAHEQEVASGADAWTTIRFAVQDFADGILRAGSEFVGTVVDGAESGAEYVGGQVEEGLTWLVDTATGVGNSVLHTWEDFWDPKKPNIFYAEGGVGLVLTLAELSAAGPEAWGAVALGTAMGRSPLPGLVAANTLMVFHPSSFFVRRPVSVAGVRDVPENERKDFGSGWNGLIGRITYAEAESGKDPVSDHVLVSVIGEGKDKRYLVSIPGTSDWPVGESTHPFGAASDMEFTAGLANPASEAVMKALEAAGAEKGSRVALVGHSLGGMAAADLTRQGGITDKYTVEGLVTFGSAIDGRVGDVPVLSITNRWDVVPATDGVISGDDRVGPFMSVELGTSSAPAPANPHDLGTYRELAGGAEPNDQTIMNSFMDDRLDDFMGPVTRQVDVAVRCGAGEDGGGGGW